MEFVLVLNAAHSVKGGVVVGGVVNTKDEFAMHCRSKFPGGAGARKPVLAGVVGPGSC